MSPLALRILVVLFVLAGAFGAHALDKHHAVGVAYQAGQAEVQGRWSTEKAVALATALKADQERRAEEKRRTDSLRDIDHENVRFEKARAAAAADAADAVGRLRIAGAGFTARAAGGAVPGDPAATGERQATDTLRALLDDSAQRHRQLGLEADAAAAAADDCAARYDALRTP
jgi:hypothetical protein